MKYLNELKPEALAGKKMLLRVDFNVPAADKDGEIETFRIKAHKHTLDYLVNSGAQVALVSHRAERTSFSPIAEQIGEALGQSLTLIPHSELGSLGLILQKCPVVLIDNIRQDPREEKNDDALAAELAKGFDFYINDAFSVCHRAHSSVVAVTKHLPSYAGFLIKKEIEHLTKALAAPAAGKVLVLGGAKISTKLPVIKNFLDKAEKILIGGAIANNFFKAQGIKVGKSVVDDSTPTQLTSSQGVMLPTDILVAENKSGQGKNEVKPLGDTADNQLIVDIGTQTAQDFAETIVGAELVIWNGPMGLAEVPAFAAGTEQTARAVAAAKYSIIGGGDTIAAADRLGLRPQYDFVSTGGGAMLVFLAGEKLPGLESLGYYQ